MATAVIDVRSDFEGLKIAAGELFTEFLAGTYRNAIGKKLENSASLEAVLADYQTERSLADGYYRRAEHLIDLSGKLQLGAAIGLREISWDEMDGLIAVNSASARFREAHPPCPNCGIPLWSRHAQICAICNGEIERRR